VEFGTEAFVVAVRELEGDERERAWSDVVEAVPAVANTQNETRRTIPVLLLTRITSHQYNHGRAKENDHE
jgi:hypothetical protein